MTTFNTGNPLGSTDVYDRYDNSENLDNFSNGQLDAYPDRFGVSRQSLQGIRNASQYQVLGAYAAGLNFTALNQVFSYLGEFYAPGPAITLPYTTTGVGAAEIANFRSVGDAVLRSDLAAPTGGDLVGVIVSGVTKDVQEFADSRGVYVAVGLGAGVDGTAVLQGAVDAWSLSPDLSIRVIGTLDVFGTVQIPNKETLNPERRLTITGGSLRKVNAGFMFTRPPGQSVPDGMGGELQLQTGHVTFDSVRFLGPRSTAGTYILDGDNVIRTKFVNCYGDGIQIAYAAQYLQSIYVDSASVFRKWSGWLLDCGHLFDIKFYGTAEAGDSFMRTRDAAADPAANSLTVRGNIEGLSGKVFSIGVCYGVLIDGNYHESNAGGDYDFSIGNGFHKGLTLIGNGFQPATAQLADVNYYPVKLGKGAANSITLIGNASTGNLFDVAAGNQSAIVDMGNWAAAGKNKFSPASSRLFSFDSVKFTASLLPGYGVNLDSYNSSVGFENTRVTVGAESVTAQITYGTANPQLSPGLYTQTAWAAGSLVLLNSPTIALRQYGAGNDRNALILGWSCLTSGSPGVWQEISMMLPY